MSSMPSPAPLPPQNQASVSNKHRHKPFAIGIAAGAEDAKYQAKYKELKRKVKDIENDNDKLYFKVLQTKLSIRRMKMERAILYERLSIVPPSPNLQDRLPLPPANAVPPQQTASRPVPTSHHHREMHDHSASLDPDQVHSLQEHIRSQGNPRAPSGPDARSLPVLDNSIASAVAPSPRMSLHSPRRISSGHESGGRHHLPTMGQMPPAHQYENTRGHSHSNASPPIHHAHPPSSHTRNRSHSSSRSHMPPQPYRSGSSHRHQFPEGLPPAQQTMHSPPLSERERPRRNDHHEYTAIQGESHAYDHRQPHHQLSPRTQTTEGRSSDRLHAHQRLGPATYNNRESPHDRRRDLERESDWELEERRRRDPRMFLFGPDPAPSVHDAIPNSYSPPLPHKSRPTPDRGNYDHHVASRSRDDSGYYQDIHAPSGYPRLSRSGTPASGSASGSGAGVTEVPSRPDSRTQYHERDRPRSSFRLRPVSQPNEDIDFVHEDGRLHNRTSSDRSAAGVGNFAVSEGSRISLDSRKRSRNDIDSDNDVGDGPSGGGLYSTGRLQEDRGSKRYHREHPQSVDNHEDSRRSSS